MDECRVIMGRGADGRRIANLQMDFVVLRCDRDQE